jgi:hypothetical protein
MPDFIGGDPTSTSGECPAVFVSHETGDWLIRGMKITDLAVIDEMNQHIGLAEDEADIWLPARMTPIIREALDGYERGRQGPGQHTFAELLEATQTSAIRIEMRDTYDETEQGYAEWRQTGDISSYGPSWTEHFAMVSAAVARGVTMRRVRVISEPVSEYIRWEYACTRLNIDAGEDIRWLPRSKAADLMLPGADCWVFDNRLIRWNFQRGDSTNPRIYTHSSDPRIVRDIVAAFHIAWDRATPHAEYKID